VLQVWLAAVQQKQAVAVQAVQAVQMAQMAQPVQPAQPVQVVPVLLLVLLVLLVLLMLLVPGLLVHADVQQKPDVRASQLELQLARSVVLAALQAAASPRQGHVHSLELGKAGVLAKPAANLRRRPLWQSLEAQRLLEALRLLERERAAELVRPAACLGHRRPPLPQLHATLLGPWPPQLPTRHLPYFERHEASSAASCCTSAPALLAPAYHLVCSLPLFLGSKLAPLPPSSPPAEYTVYAYRRRSCACF